MSCRGFATHYLKSHKRDLKSHKRALKRASQKSGKKAPKKALKKSEAGPTIDVGRIKQSRDICLGGLNDPRDIYFCGFCDRENKASG